MQAKVLVTGGTGYIGSHTVVELQQAGAEVYIIDDLSNSELSVLDGIEQITGVRPHFGQFDLCDTQAVAAYFAQHPDLDAVIHFAAYKAVGESVQQPLKYYRNNLNSLLNLLQHLSPNAMRGMVFSSSCTVYGQPEYLPVDEQAPIKIAESPYGNTKQISEEIIQDFLRTQAGVSAIALRYFNPVGAHESALIGELPRGVPNNLVPFITQTAAGLRTQLSVFGNDYPTPDGTAIRDYIHVVDLAKAHVVALQRMLNGRMKHPFEFFNLGTGTGCSVLQVVQAFERVAGRALPYVIAPRRAGDVVQIWSDTQLANNELGWRAELDLDTMMRSAWQWQQHLAQHKE